MGKVYYVYILADGPYGTLYIGMTGDLSLRVHAHKEGYFEGHTRKYGIKTLVYYEAYERPQEAITREKQLKKWRRLWKLELIKKFNPEWNDLYLELNN